MASEITLNAEFIQEKSLEDLLALEIPARVQGISEEVWQDRSESGCGIISDFGWCAFAASFRKWTRRVIYQGEFQFCVHACPLYLVLRKTCHNWEPIQAWENAVRTLSTERKKAMAKEIHEFLEANRERLVAEGERILLFEKSPIEDTKSGLLRKIYETFKHWSKAKC